MLNQITCLLLFVGFYYSAAGQEIKLPIVEHKLVYSDTVFVNNTSIDTLSARARRWVIKNFPSQNPTFNSSVQPDSLMILNGALEFDLMDLYNLNKVVYEYKIRIELFDNAYIYKISSFSGKLYEKSQYTSNYAARVSIEEDYANYLKHKKSSNDYSRRIKNFNRLFIPQLNSLYITMDPVFYADYK